MSRTLLVQQFLNGLAIGSVYAIFALGFTLVFSILRIINFAHGAVFTLGAYLTYALTGSQFGINGLLANAALPVHLPFPLALVVGSLLAGVAGVALERAGLPPAPRARRRSPAHSRVEPRRRRRARERHAVPLRRRDLLVPIQPVRRVFRPP